MDWYDVVDGTDVLQGDILFSCPNPRVVGLDVWPIEDEAAELAVDIEEGAACVLTQSCDLENDKVTEVMLGRVIDWQTAQHKAFEDGNTIVKKTEFRTALQRGNVPGVALLHKHAGEPQMDWSIVDFGRLFVLPKGVLAVVAASAGPRLRLVSPYREHLGQALARYFMRVGLPHEATAFVKEGAFHDQGRDRAG